MSTETEIVEVQVPDIGDFDDVPIIEILVSPGDEVAVDDPLLTLESDKATMDVPAPFAGTVKDLSVKVGDRVSQGATLLRIAPAEAADAAQPTKASAATSDTASSEAAAPDAVAGAISAEEQSAPSSNGAEGTSDTTDTSPPPARGEAIYASPSARRLARELGADLSSVHGSGRKGRITKDDVQNAAENGPGTPAAAGPGLGLALAPWPSIDFEKFGEVERVPRSRIARISAPNLARNWVMIPHVTHHDEADITELEAWRKQLNEEHAKEHIKLTMVAFLIRASVAALQQYPDFNSSLDGDELVRKRYYNIGFAADTPGGLVVPVIKDADRKGLLELAQELTALSGKARTGKLAPGDMNGGTFTISSLGGIGGTGFTPIVNAPEVAILGVTRAAIKPLWDGHEFRPRLMVPLSLSYDHRVIDGAAAARFVVYLVRLLSDLRRALL